MSACSQERTFHRSTRQPCQLRLKRGERRVEWGKRRQPADTLGFVPEPMNRLQGIVITPAPAKRRERTASLNEKAGASQRFGAKECFTTVGQTAGRIPILGGDTAVHGCFVELESNIVTRARREESFSLLDGVEALL